MNLPETIGYIHSFQSLGAVDGPGLRCVVFMQGCPLRCAYCHNPDTWAFAGQGANCLRLNAGDALKKILRYRPYIKYGGVTVSGGEALMQPEFVTELFSLLKKEGLHTALDTSGAGDLQKAKTVLEYTDLILADLKFSNPDDYKKYCGLDMEHILSFLDLAQAMEIPVWIRHVVVPKLTDGEEHIKKIADISRSYKNVEKIELLPFRKICESKYDKLGINFPLKDHEACSEEKIRVLEKIIAK